MMKKVISLPSYMTVSQMLEELGSSAKDVRYILSYCKKTFDLIIYEAPQDFSVVEWFEILKKQKNAELHAAIRRFNETVDRFKPLE